MNSNTAAGLVIVGRNIMKSKLLTILLLFAWTTGFTQTDSLTKDTIEEPVMVDTINAKRTDTFSMSKKQLFDKELRVIFEDNSKPDYFKYIFPILTLLLGIGVNKYLDYLKDKKQIKKTGERWQAELASIEMPISNQIEYLEEFLREHNKEIFAIPKLKVAAFLECENFNSLDKTDFIKFIQTNLGKDYKSSIQLLGRVNTFISILKNNNENLRLKFNDYLQGTSSHTTQLNLGLQELLKEFGDYGVLIEKEVKGDPTPPPEYKEMTELFVKEIFPKMETGEYDIYQLEKKFFLPLIAILGHLRLDERTKKMANIGSECISSIKGIKMEKKYLTENISTLISHYKDAETDLRGILKNFS